MFALEVEYLLGRSFAGDFRDRSEPEWPPDPGRLFSALAASYFDNGMDPGERRALEWLERQGPPQIRAGTAGEPVRTVAFVPTNYPGDAVPALRGKQPRVFAAQGPSEPVVYFVWPEADPVPEVASALDKLAGCAAYLGKACSVVRMRAADSSPEPNYVPDASGDRVLRVPSAGRLRELESLFAADLRPTAGTQQRYANLHEHPVGVEPVATEFGRMIVFRKTAGPGLPIEAALTLTDAVRRALMGIAGEAGPITEIIHGHNGDTHCALAALPFVGGKYGDGHLMGFAVALPRKASVADQRGVLRACGMLVENERGLHIPGIGDWKLEPVELAAKNSTLRAESWTRVARQWSTVTPILLDRFPKKKGPTVEEIVASACRRISLPAPDAIEHGPYSRLQGVPPVPAFRLHRKSEEKPRWGVHATLRFPVPVRGPVLLGAGRYFGLGLMRPDMEERDEER
jgi:CRISPR-associated protein Csb2